MSVRRAQITINRATNAEAVKTQKAARDVQAKYRAQELTSRRHNAAVEDFLRARQSNQDRKKRLATAAVFPPTFKRKPVPLHRPVFDDWLTVRAYAPILSDMVNYKERLDRTFAALVDPTRRAILAHLGRKDGASVSELAQPFTIKLPAVIKHLDVLDDAGLVTRSKSGRTVTVRLRPQPMREAMEWLRRYEHFWSQSLDRLAAYAESRDTEARRRGR